MLVLTRKVGESVVIGDEVYCTVMANARGQVRLAFDAPKSISIHRDEIQRRIHKEQQKEGFPQDKTSPKESIVDRLIRKFKQGIKPEAIHQ